MVWILWSKLERHVETTINIKMTEDDPNVTPKIKELNDYLMVRERDVPD